MVTLCFIKALDKIIQRLVVTNYFSTGSRNDLFIFSLVCFPVSVIIETHLIKQKYSKLNYTNASCEGTK